MKLIMKTETNHKYCNPWNAGLASETKAVAKSLGKLLDELGQINNNLVEGEIANEVYDFKASLIQKLRDDGWEVTCPKNNFNVKESK
jgi:hypothetical protein